MPFEITDDEWEFAESYFATFPKATKLPRTREEKPVKYEFNVKTIELSHSFIKSNNGKNHAKILAVGSKKDFIVAGDAHNPATHRLAGSQAAVKRAQDRDGKP